MTKVIKGLIHRIEGGQAKENWVSSLSALALFISGSILFFRSIDANVVSWSWFLTALILFAISGTIIYRNTSPAPTEAISNLDSMTAFLHNFMRSPEILVWVSAPDKKCIWFSQGWLHYTGKSLEQEMGDGWAQGVHPDDLQICLREYREAFDHRRPFRLTYRLRHNTGQYRWIVDCGSPIYGAQHEFLGYVGTCLEIHQEKSKWDEWGSIAANRARLISDTSREAQDPLVDIYRLLHSVSHSLSNPDTNASKLVVNESMSRLKTRFREVAGLIDQMVDQSISSSSDDSLRLTIQPAMLSDVAGSAIKMFESRAHEKGVRVRLTGEEGLKGLFDVFRLERVFWTILRIMIDEMPPKSEINLQIDRAGPEADWAQVRVKGVASAESKMIDPIVAADIHSSIHWSKDLSLANKIIERHSGILEAQHSADGSPEFKVVVPLKEAA